MNRVKSILRIIALALVLSAVLMLTACSSVAKEDLGVYTLKYVIRDGEKFQADDLYDTDSTLELSKNKATLTLDGESYTGEWSVQDDNLQFTVDEQTSSGTISNGVCMLNLLDSGLVYVFARDDADMSAIDLEAEAESVSLSDTQKLWNGGWYGWWSIDNAQGDWTALDGQWYDCLARISFDADGVGNLLLWDEQTSPDTAMGSVNFELNAPGKDSDNSMGTASSISGNFWLMTIGEGDWQLDPTITDYEKMIVISGSYEADEGSFDYAIVLRPWGTLWDDVEQDGMMLVPYYYETWYLPLIESGADMPDVLEPPEIVEDAETDDAEEADEN